MPNPKRLTISEAATRLNLSVSTMYRYRHLGTGPVSYKIAGTVYYDDTALDAWVEAEKRRTAKGAVA